MQSQPSQQQSSQCSSSNQQKQQQPGSSKSDINQQQANNNSGTSNNAVAVRQIQDLLEKCKVTPILQNYVDKFNYPYVNDVSTYELTLKIGQGTFGEVFKARCKRTGQLVALKKILMENEKEGFPITALREIKMLQKLKHPNITELIEVCTSKHRSGKDRFSFYLVFTFCEHDLAGLLSHSRAKLRLVDIKTMMQHILRGLHKIHSTSILHRDMKAANVLITKDGVLKLADFGLARLMMSRQQEYLYTNRVVTLWYRPPELLLGARQYGPSIDIWGAGCIMAELWTRSPIMQGDTEQKQLYLISRLCGSINPQSWPGVDKLPYYGKLELQQNLPRGLRQKFIEANPSLGVNEQALALLDQMLTLNPEHRPSAQQALDHNFFFEHPIPKENVSELLNQLPGNMFEYTTGCGAHAHRKRPAPNAQAPAPSHSHSNVAAHGGPPAQKRFHPPPQQQPSRPSQQHPSRQPGVPATAAATGQRGGSTHNQSQRPYNKQPQQPYHQSQPRQNPQQQQQQTSQPPQQHASRPLSGVHATAAAPGLSQRGDSSRNQPYYKQPYQHSQQQQPFRPPQQQPSRPSGVPATDAAPGFLQRGDSMRNQPYPTKQSQQPNNQSQLNNHHQAPPAQRKPPPPSYLTDPQNQNQPYHRV